MCIRDRHRLNVKCEIYIFKEKVVKFIKSGIIILLFYGIEMDNQHLSLMKKSAEEIVTAVEVNLEG